MKNNKMFVFSVGITALLILFLAWNNLSVTARGEFFYLESVGIILVYLTISFVLLNKVSIKKIKNRLVSLIVFLGGLGINVGLLLILISLVWIRFDVKTNCQDAVREYGGSCVEALTDLMEDESKNYRLKNTAIWTLGQLADRDALPVLKSFYTGIIPDRESLDKTISQYELKKAIKWCEDGNVTSWMY